jgi:hypothetical protein
MVSGKAGCKRRRNGDGPVKRPSGDYSGGNGWGSGINRAREVAPRTFRILSRIAVEGTRTMQTSHQVEYARAVLARPRERTGPREDVPP